MATFTTLAQLNTVAQAICTKADARFRKTVDKIAETDLATALATKINDKADATDLTTLSGKVDTLIGSETGDNTKSARSIAAEEVAKVVADAPASFDTLKEIADWIQNDTTGAAKMANDIQALQAKTVLGTHVVGGVTTEYATVKDYVEAYVAEQQASAALTAGNGIDITSGVVSAVVDSQNANGLSVGANGIALAAATGSTAGAMSAADKTKLDGIVEATSAEITALVDGLFAA